MENITTQAGFGRGKKDLLLSVPDETIAGKGKKTKNVIQKFLAFSEKQQQNKLGWIAFILAAQICALVPLTLLAISANGDHFVLWIPVIISSFATGMVNLAGLPTKITIPIFLISVLIDVFVIMLSFLL